MTAIHTTGVLTGVKQITTKNGDAMTVGKLETGQDGSWRFFFNVKAFGDNARRLADVRDGAIVTVQGWLSQSKYEKDGQTRYSLDIKMESLLAGFVPQAAAPVE